MMVALSTCALVCLLSAPNDAVLLEFSADWCGACRAAEPTVRRLVSERFPVRQVNVDRERDLAARYRVTSVPCFVMVAGGEEIDRVEGAASYARLIQMFERAGTIAATNQASEPALVRGQSTNRSGGLSLPRPLASLAKGFGGRSRSAAPEPDNSVPGVVVAVDPAPQGDLPRAASAGWNEQPVTAPPSIGPNTTHVSSVSQDALRASVRIRVEDATGHSVGSGTIIDTHGEEALVVTCGHLFRESGGRGPITVELFADGRPQSVSGALISCDLERDIALVAITPGMPVSKVRVASPGVVIQRGQPVFSVGCDRGANPTVRETTVSNIDRYVGAPNVEVADMPMDGRSGGGLFSRDGLLIGVCNAADPQDREGIFAALPIIHWELDKIGQRHIYDTATTQLADATPRRQPTAAIPDIAATRSMPREIPEANQNIPPSDDTEVICIVRSRRNPQANDQLLVVDRPSQEFMNRLAEESQRRPSASVAGLTTVPSRPQPSNTERLGPTLPATDVHPVLRAQGE